MFYWNFQPGQYFTLQGPYSQRFILPETKKSVLQYYITLRLEKWCHDTQHNGIHHNDTQHKGIICDTQHKWHSSWQYNAIMQSLRAFVKYDLKSLNVILLNVIMLSVVAPLKLSALTKSYKNSIFKCCSFFRHQS